MDYQPEQTTPFPLRFKLRRHIWELVCVTAFRWSPWFLKGYRRMLLRAFGATIAPTANVHNRAKIDCPWNLTMGEYASAGEDSWIYCLDRITIGDYACVGQRAQLLTGSHDIEDPKFTLTTKPIVVKNGAWIAASTIILPGVTIGAMSVVGAGAVVSRDVADNDVVAGNPARVVKRRTLRTAPSQS